jgi:hypothetical protein
MFDASIHAGDLYDRIMDYQRFDATRSPRFISSETEFVYSLLVTRSRLEQTFLCALSQWNISSEDDVHE